MNIALLYPGQLHTCSGGYIYNRSLLAALRKRELKVIDLSIDNKTPSQLATILEKQRISFLIQDSLAYSALTPLNLILRQSPTISILGLIHNIHSHLDHSAYSLTAEQEYLNTLNGLICVSDTIASAISSLNAEPKPCLVLNPGRPHSAPACSSERQNSESLKLICVAHLLPPKRQLELIQALAKIHEINWQLTLVGSMMLDRNYTRKIQQEIQRHQLTSKVTCPGEVSKADLSVLYPQQDILVQPSQFESFGLVLLEAFQFGIPVVSFAEGEPKQFIKNGETGFWYPELSHLSQALAELSSPNIRNRMSEACYQQHLRWPSWSVQAERLENFMQTFLQS